MKKLISAVLLGVLLLSMVPAALAAGNASMTGPGTVRAGDTITVSFSAGGGIYGGAGSVSYDPAQLTLQGYSAAIGGSWAVEFSGNNFVFYDNTMTSPISSATIFTATFTVNSGLEAGTVVSVAANNVTLSDGKQDFGVGSPTYSVTIVAPLSDNCRLVSLTVDNASITPVFSPDVMEYSAAVPFEVSALSLSATAEHPNASVSVENPGLAVAGVTAVKITVTAENGTARTYVIRVSRPQDPNYVPSANADLSKLTVEGYQLSPAFSPEVTKYYVWLPYETQSVDVSAVTADNRAKAEVAEQPELVPGQGTDIPVTVTAEDGTQKVYTITVVRAPAHEDVERFLNGEPEPTEPAAPETEPTEAPTVPTETQAPTQPTQPEEMAQEQTEGVVLTLPVLILAHLVCILVGAAIGVAVKHRANEKEE